MARKKLRQRQKKESKTERYFLLTGKKLAYAFLAFIVAIILHNLFSAIFGVEEVIFFLIAVFVIPLYFLLSIVYTLKKTIKDKPSLRKELVRISIIFAVIAGVVVLISRIILNRPAFLWLVILLIFFSYYLTRLRKRR